MDKKFFQGPIWIFITLIFVLIGTAQNFSELILDFFPKLDNYKRWIQILFMATGFSLPLFLYYIWVKKQKHRDSESEDERLEKAFKKAKWMTRRQNIFKHYPLNIITLKIIPLFICWIISKFINKEHRDHMFNDFYFPKYWTEYNYEEVTKDFFKSMFRVYINDSLKQGYEVKFGRDFNHIEIRWREKGNSSFNKLKKGYYEKIFSENSLKHIKIFTWIFPFGLHWNLIRVIKSLFQRRKN